MDGIIIFGIIFNYPMNIKIIRKMELTQCNQRKHN